MRPAFEATTLLYHLFVGEFGNVCGKADNDGRRAVFMAESVVSTSRLVGHYWVCFGLVWPQEQPPVTSVHYLSLDGTLLVGVQLADMLSNGGQPLSTNAERATIRWRIGEPGTKREIVYLIVRGRSNGKLLPPKRSGASRCR